MGVTIRGPELMFGQGSECTAAGLVCMEFPWTLFFGSKASLPSELTTEKCVLDPFVLREYSAEAYAVSFMLSGPSAAGRKSQSSELTRHCKGTKA